MNKARHNHGITKQDTLIYTFGGLLDKKGLLSAEKYDIRLDQWTSLPDIHADLSDPFCVNIKNKILITGVGRKGILSYKPSTGLYKWLAIDLPPGPRWLGCIHDKIYLFLTDKSHELDADGKIKNTFNK